MRLFKFHKEEGQLSTLTQVAAKFNNTLRYFGSSNGS